MTPVAIAGIVLMGFLAGWLASKVVLGRGFGLVGNLLIGLMGGLLGGMALDHVWPSLDTGLVGDLLVAFVGATALVTVAGVLRKVAA